MLSDVLRTINSVFCAGRCIARIPQVVFAAFIKSIVAGPGVTVDEHAELTPFSLGAWNDVIAFDEEHCIQVSCLKRRSIRTHRAIMSDVADQCFGT